MSTESQTPRTPLRSAIISGSVLVAIMFALRLVSNDDDPSHLYSPAPLFAGLMLGLFTYFQESGRTREASTIFITLGTAGLMLWSALLITGVMPATRWDLPWILVTFSIPIICLALGFRMRARATRSNAP
jgi:uncharacterized RDD family membrane protein YckC